MSKLEKAIKKFRALPTYEKEMSRYGSKDVKMKNRKDIKEYRIVTEDGTILKSKIKSRKTAYKERNKFLKTMERNVLGVESVGIEMIRTDNFIIRDKGTYRKLKM